MTEICSVQDFLNLIYQDFTGATGSNVCPTHLYFRGHSCSNFKLIPRFFRKIEDENTTKEALLRSEKLSMDSLKGQIGNSLNDWQLAALAQHYGLPTRLLDWTQNPLVALYFAVESERYFAEDGLLFVFYDKTGIRAGSACLPFGEDSRFYSSPKSSIIENVRPYRAWTDSTVNYLPRLSAQSSALTWQPDPFYDLDKQIRPEKNQRIKQYLIRSKCKNDIIKNLSIFGITGKYIFQDNIIIGNKSYDIVSICREIYYKIIYTSQSASKRD